MYSKSRNRHRTNEITEHINLKRWQKQTSEAPLWATRTKKVPKPSRTTRKVSRTRKKLLNDDRSEKNEKRGLLVES